MMKSSALRIALKLLWMLVLLLTLVTLWNPAEGFVYEAF